jgi:hypothetical protein
MNNLLKYALVIYVILIGLLFFYKPELFKSNENCNKFILPSLVIILSIISYYIVAIMQSFFS